MFSPVVLVNTRCWKYVKTSACGLAYCIVCLLVCLFFCLFFCLVVSLRSQKQMKPYLLGQLSKIKCNETEIK